MTIVLPRLISLVLVGILAVGCGGGSGSPSAPSPTPQPPATTPTPNPTPQPTPQPALAQIGGAWNGSHEFQQQGRRLFGRVAVTFDQSDRTVRGSWLFTDGAGSAGPSFNAWHGEITGTLSLDVNGATHFAGTATIVAEISSGTGACHGRVTLEGTATAASLRIDGPNVTFFDCSGSIGGFVWILTRDASSPPPPPPSPPPPPGQPGSLSCTAQSVTGPESNTTTITFDEPEFDARRTRTYSDGSYATCPYRYSDEVFQLSVNGVSLQGRYQLRTLWNGCTSTNPSVWDGGVLQNRDSALTIGVNSLPRPTVLRFSLAVDGGAPSPRFDLTVSDATGATATTSVTTLAGRIALSCSQPISSVRIGHDGPSWVLDSVAF